MRLHRHPRPANLPKHTFHGNGQVRHPKPDAHAPLERKHYHDCEWLASSCCERVRHRPCRSMRLFRHRKQAYQLQYLDVCKQLPPHRLYEYFHW